MKKTIAALLIIVALILALSSCRNSSDKQADVKQMFEGFPVTEDAYVLLTSDFLCVDGKQIPREEITYNGEQCEYVVCLEDGVIAYTYVPGTDRASADLLRIPYDTLIPEVIDTVTVDTSIFTVEHCRGAVYFAYRDPASEKTTDRLYLVYDMATGEKHVEKCDDSLRLYENSDHNRSEKYELKRYASSNSIGNVDEVIDRESGKAKQISKDNLKLCAEGKSILRIGKFKTAITEIIPVFEKDGDIYLTGCYEDGFLGCPCHCFFLKYNFESDATEFYTWVYFEDYQEVYDFYIFSKK